ncbi:MAG TPA: hypothetical protein PKM25_07290, partial [Candidatus Ozemobacteraceae bacterium]|nr:hypothetical protein [Candidatus Ozemobacteraceae bacterium]
MKQTRGGTSSKIRIRSGFALLVICALLMGMFLLLMALSRFNHGAVVQLSRVVEQERLQLAAQAGLADIVAQIQEGLNNPATPIGSLVNGTFSDPALVGAPEGQLSWSRTLAFSAGRLSHACRVAEKTVGRPVSMTGEAHLHLSEKIGPLPASFIGYLDVEATVSGAGVPATVSRERREIRLVDLRDLFLDKYVVYVKNICVNINHPKRRLVLDGLLKNGALSRAYFGNRFYPACAEFPQGENSGSNPPILFDIDFQNDRHLIENFFSPQRQFTLRDPNAAAASSDQFFRIRHPYIPFETLSSRFRLPDFYSVQEVRDFYELIINKSSAYGNVQNSVAYEIMKDYRAGGGKPENSKLFKAIVETCTKGWDYQYGYTDYSHLIGPDFKPCGLLSVSHYSGVGSYFEEYKEFNIQRLLGGKMPLLFGESRSQPVLVEGPVFLRFFKVAFFDHFISKLPALGQTFDLNIREVPLKFRRPDKAADFASRNIGRIDNLGLETVLMSRAVENLPINNLFFGETQTRNSPHQIGAPRKGDDIFPVLDEQLRTVTHLFRTSGDFMNHSITQESDGKKRLNLDGVMVVLGMDGQPLDLSGVHAYGGKGMIVLMRGNCFLGSLRRATGPSSDFLRLYLLGGSFSVRGEENPTRIEASLIATTYRPGSREASKGFDPNHHAVTIVGQLVVDDLLELLNIDE